ncbi:Arylsulfatase 3 [Colletotrichum truncatum]|uniref:Arylsulfatase 3 n=1 Tax=Colletotrichum truncatum TaxID=5467 RepID=A0ACC3YFN3_COLTU|nr:Arylsulfatase 3 [Colletotrichum truncatum]KAF6788374.1 Arylsulfatase 3 [Colletotrichum truncatum]
MSLKSLVAFAGLFSTSVGSLLQSDGSQRPLISPASSRKPNIVFILTDDQDLHMNSLDYVPLIKKHLIDQGTLYKRHFCTTAVCCPSRVTLWTGKAAHNTNVTDIFPPYGGYPKFVAEGHNENYLPLFLQNAGYNTYYTGKLFNAHTVDNYDSPHAAGWTGSDFLLDPFTYSYLNATFQRDKDAPVSHEGDYSTDVLAGKALGFLDDAVAADKPFFLGIAPVAPHSNVQSNVIDDGSNHNPKGIIATPPIPAERHAHLFPDAVVPRTDNFNPDKESGANWVRKQPKQSEENVAFNDHFYRNRLRALQAVDELVDSVVAKLEEYGILDETYIFYTTDNGYHIGHHRLQPGKECGYEEDINIPLIVRGPHVPEGKVAEIVTTHQDLVPTILGLAQAPIHADFDGLAIPLTEGDFADATKTRHEHVTVEYWGFAASEGPWGYFGRNDSFVFNNTYKALRVVSNEYNLYYSVWCNNEHELYDLNSDPGQLNNLLHEESTATSIFGFSISKVVSRLDSLLLVTKSCKGSVCTHPWRALHPQGNVDTLRDALSPRFDAFYEQQQVKVEYSRCEMGYLIDAEGPQFEQDGLVYWKGLNWGDWV